MSERLALFRDGISTAISKPVGVGLGMYRSAHGVAAHNDFVFLITSLGFVGGALYIGLFLLMAIRLWKAPPTAERWLAIALVTCVFISGNASQYILAQHPWMFLTIAWLATDPHLMPASNAAAIEDYELSYEQPGAFA